MDNIIIKTGKVDTVLTVFISPHCPICQQYSVILNDINKLTNSHDIKMIGVVSGTYYNQDMVDRFVSKFNIEYNILIDSNYVQRDRWNATVTPEAVLSIGDSVYYRGLIDDWFYEIGKSSNKTTSHYLLDAIQSMIGNREIVHKKTNPVGCVLE
ncbi:MAG: redoxin family protein [Flavobacteriales bacterium]|nr:redoxin family protein [Flavobacteriales bacterium]